MQLALERYRDRDERAQRWVRRHPRLLEGGQVDGGEVGDLGQLLLREPVLETAQLRDRPAGPPSLGARLNG